MHFYGYMTVNFGAGNLLKDGGSLIGGSLKKGCKSSLGKQHRTGKTLKVHTRGLLDKFINPGYS